MTVGNCFQELCFQHFLTITLVIFSKKRSSQDEYPAYVPNLVCEADYLNKHQLSCTSLKEKKVSQPSQPKSKQNLNQTQTTNKGQPLIWEFQSELFGLPSLTATFRQGCTSLTRGHFCALPGFFLEVWMHSPTCQPNFVSMCQYRHESGRTLCVWSSNSTEDAGAYSLASPPEGIPRRFVLFPLLLQLHFCFLQSEAHTYMWKNHISMNSISGFMSQTFLSM